ncbi:ORC ubiquitin ligase 1 [Corythoichthys intestinalis]|uniref:ORC ubiquitin ligase 1 n=1 Tax=Corythoichthys intestinalis TaxID=161448 RepID=UPI0025A6582C|nr:ORC ubiquitin ligase 1 [Corythoichthys intestinalis]XP_061796050.1 ORC ubiquitin ligase 1-like [Nerophis lumbriciformis]
MALSFQTSTLCLTLPMSCQICLGKVRQPVICGNHHVFCSSCMEMWLKNASQCPSCRVPITTENPCRELIGGTNDTDHIESPAMRKRLRKTRGDLLLRDYEEEIEGLSRENEELKSKNQNLELQLRKALDPCSISSVHADEKKVDPSIMKEWANRLQTANDVCDKLKQDFDKLKEANKTLRSQNVDLVQENSRLKAEVVSRSPQKFGRYTVAALEAKIQQYQRDTDHLKRALERSDQYIDDLENRVRTSEKRCAEMQESCKKKAPGLDSLTQQQRIHMMMMRSLSDNERGSICSNPEADALTFSTPHSLMFSSCTDHKDSLKHPCGLSEKAEDMDGTSSDFFPSTPSSAFRSLTLRSPGVREKKVAFKPVTHLRRLDFDDVPSPGKTTTEKQFSDGDMFPKCLPTNSDDVQPLKPVFWGSWKHSESNEQSSPGPSKEHTATDSTAPGFVADEPDSFQKSSEASMDAAYLNKISELDTMMLDVDSSSSRGSQLSLASLPADLDHTLVAEPQTCADVEAQRVTVNNEASGDGTGERCPPSLVSHVEENRVPGCVEHGAASHTEELSFDLLFDSLEETKAGPSGSVSPASRCKDHDISSPCGKPVNTSEHRHTLNAGQPTKRKSHSPFNASSPTKLSKLM